MTRSISVPPQPRRLQAEPSGSIIAKILQPGSTGPEEPVLLDDVSWEFYEHFLEELDRLKRHLRVTYDDGRMEIMTLTNRHEQQKKLLARLVEMYSLVRDLDITGVGSVTLKKPRRKGLEPDECYYVQTPAPDVTVMRLDLKEYAPPDLGIEVDVSRSSIPRQPVYAFIGVPEVWRFDGQRITILLRKRDGKYRTAARSKTFAELSAADVNRFLAMAEKQKLSQSAVVRAFRDWLEEGR
jgi:Uma2 family endonuclease